MDMMIGQGEFVDKSIVVVIGGVRIKSFWFLTKKKVRSSRAAAGMNESQTQAALSATKSGSPPSPISSPSPLCIPVISSTFIV
jgi:hypothetical protein